MKKIYQLLVLFSIVLCMNSCGIYNQNLMFQTKDNKSIVGDSLAKKVASAEGNYIIHPSDQIEIKVYTNNGERLVDPNSEFSTSGVGGSNSTGSAQNQIVQYNVLANGTTVFPMIGLVKVQGLTMLQLDSLLQVKYSKFYQDVFVSSKCVNRRVIVLGSTGGLGKLSGQVVHLGNEKMNLIEVLAMVGGLDEQAKSYNIKLIRGDLSNPNVDVIDLSTIEGMRKSNLNVQPNDIIYIERIRKGGRQTLQEFAPVFTILTLVTTLIVLFRR